MKIFLKFIWKNISIIVAIIIGFLTFNYFGWDKIEDDSSLLILSVGLVSIVTYISNFLRTQVNDNGKDNYYLGQNIVRREYYDSKWLKAFDNFNITLFFWIVALIPIIVLFTKADINNSVINDFINIIKDNYRLLKSIWAGAFLVSAFYCIGVLIESIKLSRLSFSQKGLLSGNRKSKNEEIVYRRVKQKYFAEFEKKFSFFKVTSLSNKVKKIENQVDIYLYIEEGKDNCGDNSEELAVYYSIVFSCEFMTLYNKIQKYFNYKRNDLDYYGKALMRYMRYYYKEKWENLNYSMLQKRIPIVSFLSAAYFDIFEMSIFEDHLSRFESYIKEFWDMHDYTKFYDSTSPYMNVVITQIFKYLFEILNNDEFWQNPEKNLSELLSIFRRLKSLDEGENRREIIEYRPNNRLGYCDELMRRFINKIANFTELNDVIIDKIQKYSPLDYRKNGELSEIIQNSILNTITEEVIFSLKSLDFMLYFLDVNKIIACLIFVIAYRERSGKKYMSIDEYKIWESHLKGCKYEIDFLDEKSIDAICEYIENSRVSHFMFESFIRWILESIDKQFNEELYYEYNKNNPRLSFGGYEIIRLLINNDYLYLFRVKNNKEIIDSLRGIKDIYEYKGEIDIF